MCSVFLSSVCFDVTDLLSCFCLHPEDTARTFPGNTKNLNLSLNKSKKERSQKRNKLKKKQIKKETSQKRNKSKKRPARAAGLPRPRPVREGMIYFFIRGSCCFRTALSSFKQTDHRSRRRSSSGYLPLLLPIRRHRRFCPGSPHGCRLRTRPR